MGSIAIVHDIIREDGFTMPGPPGIFGHQMTGSALGRRRIGRASIQALDPLHMLAGIEGAMNMTPLTIARDDSITF